MRRPNPWRSSTSFGTHEGSAGGVRAKGLLKRNVLGLVETIRMRLKERRDHRLGEMMSKELAGHGIVISPDVDGERLDRIICDDKSRLDGINRLGGQIRGFGENDDRTPPIGPVPSGVFEGNGSSGSSMASEDGSRPCPDIPLGQDGPGLDGVAGTGKLRHLRNAWDRIKGMLRRIVCRRQRVEEAIERGEPRGGSADPGRYEYRYSIGSDAPESRIPADSFIGKFRRLLLDPGQLRKDPAFNQGGWESSILRTMIREAEESEQAGMRGDIDLKGIAKTSKGLLKGTKPSKLSGERFKEIAGLLESEDPEERGAAIFIIAARKAREHLGDMLRLADDEDRMVRSAAFLALFNFRDLETAKSLIGLMRRSPAHVQPAIAILARMKARGQDGMRLVIQAIEETMGEDWFQEAKEKNTESYRKIMQALNKVLYVSGSRSVAMKPWWLVPTRPESQRMAWWDGNRDANLTEKARWLGEQLQRTYPSSSVDVSILGKGLSPRLKESMGGDAKRIVQEKTGKSLDGVSMSELAELMMDPFGGLYGDRVRRYARKALLKELGRKRRREIERRRGKKLKRMTDEELGQLYWDHKNRGLPVSARGRTPSPKDMVLDFMSRSMQGYPSRYDLDPSVLRMPSGSGPGLSAPAQAAGPEASPERHHEFFVGVVISSIERSRDRFVKSLARKEKKAIERDCGKGIKDLSDDELARSALKHAKKKVLALMDMKKEVYCPRCGGDGERGKKCGDCGTMLY